MRTFNITISTTIGDDIPVEVSASYSPGYRCSCDDEPEDGEVEIDSIWGEDGSAIDWDSLNEPEQKRIEEMAMERGEERAGECDDEDCD